MMEPVSFSVVLAAVTASSIAAIVAYIQQFLRGKERRKAEVKVGDVKISIEGNLTPAQLGSVASKITKMIADENQSQKQKDSEQGGQRS
jgi:hypothetical protein